MSLTERKENCLGLSEAESGKRRQKGQRETERHSKHVCVGSCTVYLEAVGGEGADDLWRDIQAWRAGQREAAVQILATHSLLHQPVNQCIANQNAEQLSSFRVNQNTRQALSLHSGYQYLNQLSMRN